MRQQVGPQSGVSRGYASAEIRTPGGAAGGQGHGGPQGAPRGAPRSVAVQVRAAAAAHLLGGLRLHQPLALAQDRGAVLRAEPGSRGAGGGAFAS
jgi:hypothetical protein